MSKQVCNLKEYRVQVLGKLHEQSYCPGSVSTTKMINNALTSTRTASEVQLRARMRTVMVASVAFMVTAICLEESLSLVVGVLSRCLAQ